MQEKTDINTGHYIELMDRLHITMCNIEEHISAHPLVEHLDSDTVSNRLEHAVELLWEVYQYVGSVVHQD